MNTKFTNLPLDIINEIIFCCDYKSILYLNCTCKKFTLESILIKSKRLKNSVGNSTHAIPIKCLWKIQTHDDMIMSIMKYIFDNNIVFAYGDQITFLKKGNEGCIGFIGCQGYMTITPTYKIFEKILIFTD